VVRHATAVLGRDPYRSVSLGSQEEAGADPPGQSMDDEHSGERRADEPRDDERGHQRDSAAALLLGAVVVAVLMVAYVYLR
jgi:hypothetical protein